MGTQKTTQRIFVINRGLILFRSWFRQGDAQRVGIEIAKNDYVIFDTVDLMMKMI